MMYNLNLYIFASNVSNNYFKLDFIKINIFTMRGT